MIYLIEGLSAFMRKIRNARNRQFTSAVRDGLCGNEDSTSASTGNQHGQPARAKRAAQAPTENVDEDTVEDALLNLQVLHGVLIHHTNAPVETAQWIAVFTQNISTIPYKRQKEQDNDASAAFCMDAGQVRTGDGAYDTYVRMLQEIVRVTAPMAYGIANEFPSVTKLVRGMEEGGPLRLEDVRKSANRDGALSDRNIGQAISRRIHKIFTGRDETSTDV
jgi:crossover junction endonuclease EME1